MRVDAYNAVSQIYQSNAKVNTAKKTAGNSEFTDKLEISNAAKSYQTAKAAVKAADDVRMDKVEALKAKFANKTYHVSSEEVADKIIADAETLVF